MTGVCICLCRFNVNYVPSAIVYLTLLVDWHGQDARYLRGKGALANDSFLFGIAVLALSIPAAIAVCVVCG